LEPGEPRIAAAAPVTSVTADRSPDPNPSTSTDTDIRTAARTESDIRPIRSSIRSSIRPSIFDDEFFRSPIPRRAEEAEDRSEDHTAEAAAAPNGSGVQSAAAALFNSPVFHTSAGQPTHQTLASEAAEDFHPLPPQLRPSYNAGRVQELSRATAREIIRDTDRAVLSSPRVPTFGALQADPAEADELDIPAFLRRGV
jgi:hypothetical protein